MRLDLVLEAYSMIYRSSSVLNLDMKLVAFLFISVIHCYLFMLLLKRTLEQTFSHHNSCQVIYNARSV